ncbi:hypothetical protein GQ54DRAFT_303605 [Martensiomyces pterosporus]|nr:hypothetical protein GQ54DRAFT_303605 [Martensiomyces pterosporus]
MLSANNILKSHLPIPASLGGHYAASPAQQHRDSGTSNSSNNATVTAGQNAPPGSTMRMNMMASTNSSGTAATPSPSFDPAAAYTSAATSADANTTASAFALAATAAMSAASTSSTAAAAAAAAIAVAAAVAATASGSSCSPSAAPSPSSSLLSRAGLPLPQTMASSDASASNDSVSSGCAPPSSGDNGSNNGVGLIDRGAISSAAASAGAHGDVGAGMTSSSPLVAPRPVSAQQLGPPAWMLAALPLEVLLGLAVPNYKQKIINDVFFTPEERHESPQLTPVSDLEDTRLRPLAPSDGLESLDPSADLALFADPQGAESRSAWVTEEIESTVSASTRQPSPTPTVTSDHDPLSPAAVGLADMCSKGGSGSIAVDSAEDSTACSEKIHASPLSAHVAQSKSQYSW